MLIMGITVTSLLLVGNHFLWNSQVKQTTKFNFKEVKLKMETGNICQRENNPTKEQNSTHFL